VDYLALVDLDLTLYDYDGLRRRAMRAALGGTGLGPHRTAVEELFDRLLVPYGDLLACAGLPNYRRRWNDPGVFRLCAALAREPDPTAVSEALMRALSPALASLKAPPTQGPFERLWQARGVLLRERSSNGVQRLRRLTTRGGRGPAGAEAGRARRAFDREVRTRARLYPGARAFLQALRREGFVVAVVSEGDERVQMGKARALGVHRLVDGVFVTGSCCGAEGVLRRLWRLAVSLPEGGDARAGSTLRSLATLYDRVHPLSVKSPEMYARLLAALMGPRRGWSSAFSRCADGRALPAADRRPGVAVIGDRYDKDLYPAMLAFGPIYTMRVATGKYGHTWSATALSKSRHPHPTAVVSDMREAARRVRSMRREIPRGPAPGMAPRWRHRAWPGQGRALAVVRDAFGVSGRRLTDRLRSLQESQA